MPIERSTAPRPEPSLGQVRDGVHSTSIRIYVEDTDHAGVVYHARYLHFFERARTQLLALAGYRQRDLMARAAGPLGFMVRRARVDYRAPGHLDDTITVETRIARLGGASMDFDQQARRGADALALGTISVACVDAAGRPRRMPAAMAQDLLTLMTAKEDEVNGAE